MANKKTAGEFPHMVRSIVGRCHVGQSNRAVIRYFISRLREGYKTWSAVSRSERKRYMRWIVEAHAENRKLYRSVMNGRF